MRRVRLDGLPCRLRRGLGGGHEVFLAHSFAEGVDGFLFLLEEEGAHVWGEVGFAEHDLGHGVGLDHGEDGVGGGRRRTRLRGGGGVLVPDVEGRAILESDI
jgi:hypothetical protein